jgi:hypothetical protein
MKRNPRPRGRGFVISLLPWCHKGDRRCRDLRCFKPPLPTSHDSAPVLGYAPGITRSAFKMMASSSSSASALLLAATAQLDTAAKLRSCNTILE